MTTKNENTGTEFTSEQPKFLIRDINELFDLNYSRREYTDFIKQKKIPEPKKLGKGSYRYWTCEDLTLIGEEYDPLVESSSEEAIVISVFVQKGGGSWKTTFTLNFSKFLAMRGKKVLCIGLDPQQNLSHKFGIDNRKETVAKTRVYYKGLYEVIFENEPIKNVIYPTNTKNINIIPESPKLSSLSIQLVNLDFRETQLKSKIQDIKKNFDVILIDNNAAWDSATFNSLYASDILISPVGIDANSQETLETFVENINTRLQGNNLRDVICAPGFAEKTSALKGSILASYQNQKTYGNLFTRNKVRRAITLDEANFLKLSIFEHAPRDPVAEDLKRLCREIWERIAIPPTPSTIQ